MAPAVRWVVVVALLSAGTAEAQFGNRSIGASVGYQKLYNRPDLDWVLPVGLYYTNYLESGFEVIARVHGALVTNAVNGTQAFATSGGLGVRKLFLEEQIRPYVALELSYFVAFFTGADTYYVGPTAAAGVEVMVMREIAVGARAQYTYFWMLNLTPVFGPEFTLTVSAYF